MTLKVQAKVLCTKGVEGEGARRLCLVLYIQNRSDQRWKTETQKKIMHIFGREGIEYGYENSEVLECHAKCQGYRRHE